MPELRDWYDRAAVAGRIRQPPVAELADRGRRRAHRTAAVRVTGVAVLAGLVGAPLLTLPGGNPWDGSGGSPSETPGVAWGQSGPGVQFDDVDHGVTTYTRWYKVDGTDSWVCTRYFAVTRDGGSTWSEAQELPELPDERQVEMTAGCLFREPTWIAADTLVMPINGWVRGAHLAAGLDPPVASYLSQDAGRTWQEYEPKVQTAEAVPEEVTPHVFCDEQVTVDEEDPASFHVECPEAWVGWYDPATGDQVVLSDSPPVRPLSSLDARAHSDTVARKITEASDGSLWVAGHDASGEYHVSVSRDRGRTWLSWSPGGLPDGGDPAAAVRTQDGTTAYLFLTADADAPGRVLLYRTTDGGETWLHLPAGDRFEGIRSTWVTRDGHLLVQDATDRHHVSRDNGITFQPAEVQVWEVVPVPGGYWATVERIADTPDSYGAVSDDGVTWRPIQHPPGA